MWLRDWDFVHKARVRFLREEEEIFFLNNGFPSRFTSLHCGVHLATADDLRPKEKYNIPHIIRKTILCVNNINYPDSIPLPETGISSRNGPLCRSTVLRGTSVILTFDGCSLHLHYLTWTLSLRIQRADKHSKASSKNFELSRTSR